MPRKRSALSPVQIDADDSYQLCVCARKKIRDAACLLPSLARSLLLPLFCSLPAFANIGFKPAQNSAQRKAAAVAAAEAVASPAAETPQPQDVPPCLLDRLLRNNRPALHPRYGRRRFSFPGAISRC